MDPNLGRSAEAGVQSAYPSSPSPSGYAIFGTVPVGLERVETGRVATGYRRIS